MSVYGSWYITSQGGTQAVVADTPEAFDNATTAGPKSSECTHTSPGSLSFSSAGFYNVYAVSTVSHSVNNTNIHLSIVVGGTQQTAQEQHRKVETGGDVGNMRLLGQVALDANEALTINVEADKTGDVTWENLVVFAERVDDRTPGRAHGAWYMTTPDDTQSFSKGVYQDLAFSPDGSTAGPTSSVSADGETALTVTNAGTYLVEANMSPTFATASTWTFRVMVDDVAQTAWNQQRKLQAISDTGNVGLIAVLTLTASQTVEINCGTATWSGSEPRTMTWNHASGYIRRLDA